MHDWESLSHVCWDCKFHVVIVPKYRNEVLYGKPRRRVGEILRDLCWQRGVEFLEGHLMPLHIGADKFQNSRVLEAIFGAGWLDKKPT